MHTQAKSKIDALLSKIEQLGTIELADIAIAMPLNSEIVPTISRSTQALETTLNISLPEDFQKLWQKCNGLRLFERLPDVIGDLVCSDRRQYAQTALVFYRFPH